MENPQLSLPVEQPGRRQTLGVGNRKSWEFRGIYFRVLLSATKPPTFDLLHIDVHGSEIGMGFKLHTRHVPLPLPFCKEMWFSQVLLNPFEHTIFVGFAGFYPWIFDVDKRGILSLKRGFHPHHNLLLVVRRRRSQRCPLVARKRTRNRFIQNEAAVSTFSDWTRSICFHLSFRVEVTKVSKFFQNLQNFFKKFSLKSTVFDLKKFININQPPSSVYNKRKSFKALVLFHYSSSFFTFKKT
jgi:hypothetical protein